MKSISYSSFSPLNIFLHFLLLHTFLASFTLQTVTADKILFLLPIASKSHVNIFEPLARALAEKNHDIVFMAPVTYSDMPRNVHQLQIISEQEIFGTVQQNPFMLRELGWFKGMLANNTMGPLLTKCGEVLQSPEFQQLVTQQNFDLVIIDILMSYCAAGAIPALKASSILVTCYPSPSILTNDFGNRLPPSFVVEPMTFLPHQMDFLQRLQNVLLGFGMYFGSLYGFAYPSEKLYRKYLPNGDSLPDIHEIQRNASLIFSNSHWAMTHPRPLLPSVIEIGGIHTRPAKPLPKNIEEFVNGSGTGGEDGFIYFSFGSIVKGNAMPEKYRKIFINVFSKLKLKVLWKWEEDSMQGLTAKNVFLSNWLPQQDILGHKNIKLFMSHGGLLSTQEAVYHGVPMLALPIWGDQDLNSKRVEAAGIAKIFEILTMTEESLEAALREMLENPEYTQRAKEMSQIFRDLPHTPLENAVFWAEYVLRHKGAPHLKSYASQLNFFQYYILDVVAFLLVVLVSVLLLLRTLCRCLCCRTKSGENTKKEKVQ